MDVTYEWLAEQRGRDVGLESPAGTVALTVTEAVPHAGGHPGGSLVFSGPASQPLDQGTYEIVHEQVGGAIFIVPLGDDGVTRRYQAVFA